MKEKIKKITVDSTGTIREILQAIDRGGLGVALLVEPGSEKFVGLITDGDVRRALLKGLGLESSAGRIDHPKTITATVDMDMDEISAMFSEPIRVVPVLDSDRRVVDLAIFDTRVYFPVAEPKLGDAELRYVSECVLTGWVSSAGKFVKKFEEQFAEFCGTKYGISSSSGTTALHLSLVALGIGSGDEVIVPSFTFISTANAVTFTGAKPVFVDSEPRTWNISPDGIKKAVTAKTKAIIPVHVYGHPADMGPILNIARENNLAVVEDAAEAHGALYKEKKVGSFGDMGMFSFYGNKIITTGEGGMIVTDNEDLAEKMRILRDHGMDPERRYWHSVLGYNYRMTNIQAALGVGQMERIDQIVEQKRSNAALYNKGLQNIPGITLPPEAVWAKNIYWLYSILIDEEEFGMSSKELGEQLKKRGIETRPLFPPVHQQPIYNTGQSLPVCEMLSRCGLSLPSSVNLNGDEIERITGEIRDCGIDNSRFEIG
jgi:perosamine synthetase